MTFTTRQKKQQHFQAAFHLLATHEETLYTQSQLCKKLRQMGIKVSTSSFSNLVNQKQVSITTLTTVIKGLDQIIAKELDFDYNAIKGTYDFLNTPNWQPQQVPEELDVYNLVNSKADFVFHHDGRRTIQEKTAFFQLARHEISFLGIRLRQFASYFRDRKDAEFKDHILHLLSQGVDFNCYVLNPDCNEARLYFADQAKVLERERNGEKVINDVLAELIDIQAEINKMELAGQFKIWTYAHLPSAHFLVVDGAYYYGKLLVSNYLFNVPRSKVPVLEVHHKQCPKLFKLYWHSFCSLTQDAKLHIV